MKELINLYEKLIAYQQLQIEAEEKFLQSLKATSSQPLKKIEQTKHLKEREAKLLAHHQKTKNNRARRN